MELVVLGMHRSGTSALTGLLNLMGAYFSPDQMSAGANAENPSGFWERRDVRNLDDFLLKSVNCDWNCVHNFRVELLDKKTIEEFEVGANKILEELNQHETWVIKEPGLCLLFPLWEKNIDECVCFHIYRNPVEIARSLHTRDGTPENVGIALWEKYAREALYVSRGQLNIFVSHKSLMTNPHSVACDIEEKLSRRGFHGLSVPALEDVEKLIDIDLYRERDTEKDCGDFLNRQQEVLFEEFVNGEKSTQRSVSRDVSRGCDLVLQEFEEDNYIRRAERDITQEKLEDTREELESVEIKYKSVIQVRDEIALERNT
jgi:hypothetical protein